MTKLAFLPTSAGDATTRAPSAPALAAFSAAMSHTVSAKPRLTRCFAIARPMRPTPMMPTRSFACSLAMAVVLLGGLRRHVTLGEIACDRLGRALRGIAKAAAGGALQQEALARLHRVARRGARLVLVGGAEPHHEARAAARLAAGDALRRKARLVEPADHGRILEQLVLAPQAQAPAPPPGAARIRHEIEARDAAGIFRLEDLDRRDVQVGEMRRGRRRPIVPHAAAIGRSHDLVLHGRLPRPRSRIGDAERAR